MKKITIASYTPYLKDVDDAILKKYLCYVGADVEIVSWDNKDYEWTKRDLILIRSTWDYHERLKEYVEWLDYLKKNHVKTFNDVDIIKNNIFKEKQIQWLKEQNIEHFDCEVFSLNDFEGMKKPEKTLKETIKKYLPNYYGNSLFVLKPTVSARSNNTYLIDPFGLNQDENAHVTNNYEEIFKQLLNRFSDRGIILQVYAEGIKDGEYGMVFLNGKLVQSVRKMPGKLYGKKEKESVESLPEGLIDFAYGVVRKLPSDKVLIARVDAVIEEGIPKIMELELAEPNIYIRETDGIGLNVYDPDWYLPQVEKVGPHNQDLIQFAINILDRIDS